MTAIDTPHQDPRAETDEADTKRPGSFSRWRSRLGPRTIGAIYVWILLCIFFTILRPVTFPVYATVEQVCNEYAITAIVALGLLMALASGVYDLSVGSVVGLSGISTAWFLAHVSPNPWLALAAGVVTGLLCGAINVAVVLGAGVDSFIGTLATSSIFGAFILAISGNTDITNNVAGKFQSTFGIDSVIGMTAPVGLMFIGMLVLAFVLEKTAFGRRVYAIGYDDEVARLAGIRVNGTRAIGLIVSAAFAGLAGVLETASLGAGDPTIGPAYLLPAYAGAFLGATQFRGGRFNPWGCVVAVLLLGTADVGLLLMGAPEWAPSIFEGALLILAVSLTRTGRSALGKLLPRRRPRRTGTSVGSPPAEHTGESSNAE
jgi:ribose transport system permease protein